MGPGKRIEAPAAIRPSQSDATLMLSLPRNEAGFKALVSALKSHRDKCNIEFTNAAIHNVHDDTVRSRALVLSGQVKGLNDVLDLLDRLTVGGTNDD